MAQLLTAADVQRLIANPSGEARAETAAKVAAAFDRGALSEAERTLAEQIFRVMVQDAEVKVRESLSSHLKSSANLPHDIAVKMAKDVEQVSLPVLEFSKVLSDTDLIDIVRSRRPSPSAPKSPVWSRTHSSIMARPAAWLPRSPPTRALRSALPRSTRFSTSTVRTSW